MNYDMNVVSEKSKMLEIFDKLEKGNVLHIQTRKRTILDRGVVITRKNRNYVELGHLHSNAGYHKLKKFEKTLLIKHIDGGNPEDWEKVQKLIVGNNVGI